MRDIIKPALTLFIICFLAAAALSVTYDATDEVISANIEHEAEDARKAVLPKADNFELVEPDIYEEAASVTVSPGLVKEVQKAFTAGKYCGVVVTVDIKGYGGIISVITGIDAEGRISGATVVESSETPGLGSHAAEKPYLSQFTGIIPSAPLALVHGSAAAGEEIEAVSGATISSRAVIRAVQKAVNVAGFLASFEGGS